MIFQHTIVSHDKAQFDKDCNKFRQEHLNELRSIEYAISSFPMQVEQPNIPGIHQLNQKQVQIEVTVVFSCLFTYEVEKAEP